MPTARELLEQADALMRRNRKRGKGRHGGPPTLTDALGIDRGTSLAPTIILPESVRTEADPIALDTLSDLPVLTDVVDVWPPSSIAPADAPTADGASPATLDDALEADALAGEADSPEARIEADAAPAVAAGPDEAPGTDATSTAPSGAMPSDEPAYAGAAEQPGVTEPSPLLDEEFILEIPPVPTAGTAGSAPTEARLPVSVERPSVVAPGSREWEALAEEIRMQVLQRVDLFTDTGMREQLAARLRPIVDRASAELIETINHALGELVRGYVAEAIEREIESWRKRSG